MHSPTSRDHGVTSPLSVTETEQPPLSPSNLSPEEPPQFSQNTSFSKARITDRLVAAITTPSIPVVSAALSIFMLIVGAVIISVVSEVLYHRTLDIFAESALNSVVSRVVLETTKGFRAMEYSLDPIVYANRMGGRLIPTLEEVEQRRLGLVSPLDPSIANVSSKSFPYNLGNKLPNNTLSISTWRDYFGTVMAATKLSSLAYYSNFDLVFIDGSYLTLETVMPNSFVSVLYYTPVLYDGELLQNASAADGQNVSYYYVRRTPVTTGANLLFSKSTIVPSPLTDRRKESWYSQAVSQSSTFDVDTVRGWGSPYYDIITGSAWIDLVARLDTPSGSLGRVRLSYSLDDLGWFPQSYTDWIPMPSVQIFIIAQETDVIFGTPSFSADPRRSIFNETVPMSYELTSAQKDINCILTPDTLLGTQVKSCRHTVSTYGNGVLKVAREVAKPKYSQWTFFTFPRSDDKRTGKTTFDAPVYQSFTFDNKRYFVSSTGISMETIANPKLVTLVIVPESEVIGVLSEVRDIVIIITIAIIILLAILFTIAARFMFTPLSNIASLMTYSAYLHDTWSASASDTSVSNLDRTRLERFRELAEDRSLSRWAEVRAIQESYWAMSDELQALKAYIPEHLREEIIRRHLGGSSSNSQLRGASKFELPDISGVPIVGIGPSRPLSPTEVLLLRPGETTEELREIGPNIRLDTLVTLDGEANNVGDGNDRSNNNDVSEAEAPHVAPQMPPLNLKQLSNPLKHNTTNQNRPANETETSPRRQSSKPHHHNTSSAAADGADLPIYFADNCLIDRDITVVHLNILNFHSYARKRHPMTISSDFAEFITFISAEAKKFGGVLESFFSDKIWVSFNATSKCVHHQIAACYFAFHVTSIANGTSVRYRQLLPREAPKDGGKAKIPTVDKRFAICLSGLNCGVATGRAFVGPLGNKSIKRHTIISNAIPEAVCLERQGTRYSGCNVLIGGDMLQHIDGYCQYMLLDVSLLPGSSGKRRLVAVLMGPMLGPKTNITAVKRWVTAKPAAGHQTDTINPPTRYVYPMEEPIVIMEPEVNKIDSPHQHLSQSKYVDRCVPTQNIFAIVNDGFRAALDNKFDKATKRMNEAKAQIATNKSMYYLKTDANDISPPPFAEESEHKAMISFMLHLIKTFIDNLIDGHSYASALGEANMPIERLINLSLASSNGQK